MERIMSNVMDVVRARLRIYDGEQVIYETVNVDCRTPTGAILSALHQMDLDMRSCKIPVDVYLTRIEIVLLDPVHPDVEAILRPN